MPSRRTCRTSILKISGDSRRSLLAAALLLSAGATRLAAQGFVATGQVMHVGLRDTTPLANQRVFLHEVGRSGGAPVDSTRTGATGAYQLHSPRADTTNVYFVSVAWDGVSYVSLPLRDIAKRRSAVDPLFVYDTSSTRPTLVVSQRHLIVRAPDPDGSRHVLELIVLRNPGTLTRIAADTLHAIWASAIATGAVQFEVGQSDVSDRAVAHRGDSIFVYAAVPPGEKQVVLQYVLPGSRHELELPIDQPMDRFNVLVDDTLATLVKGPVTAVGLETMEGTRYARFMGDHMSAGGEVVVRFRRSPFAAARFWWVLVLLAGGALLFGLRRAVRPGAAALAPQSPDALAAQIAALDASFEAAAQPSDAERAAYEQRRAALKARLNAALATGGPKP